MLEFFSLMLITFANVNNQNHNQVFSTAQKRSIVTDFVQSKWSPNVGNAWGRPESKDDFARQILSKRSKNNMVSREDFLKRLVEIEGLNAGHFTTNKKAEELVAPIAGLIEHSDNEELDRVLRAQERGGATNERSHE